jgi:hypothetical protein
MEVHDVVLEHAFSIAVLYSLVRAGVPQYNA